MKYGAWFSLRLNPYSKNILNHKMIDWTYRSPAPSLPITRIVGPSNDMLWDENTGLLLIVKASAAVVVVVVGVVAAASKLLSVPAATAIATTAIKASRFESHIMAVRQACQARVHVEGYREAGGAVPSANNILPPCAPRARSVEGLTGPTTVVPLSVVPPPVAVPACRRLAPSSSARKLVRVPQTAVVLQQV